MAEHNAVARPYAQAIFELAAEDSSYAAWADVLDAGAVAVGDDSLARLITTPGADLAPVVSVVTEVCQKAAAGKDEQVANLVRLLAENRRLAALPAIAVQFHTLKAEVENTLDVTLTAATPVDEALQSKMADALKQRFGREINLQFELDESLVGGAKILAGDLVIDGSVSTGLSKLASTLTN